jgi:hypothetical protein
VISATRRHYECGASSTLPQASRQTVAAYGDPNPPAVLPDVATVMRCELEWHPPYEAHRALVRHLPLTECRGIWASWHDDEDEPVYRIDDRAHCLYGIDDRYPACTLYYAHPRRHTWHLEPPNTEPAAVTPASVLFDAERLCRRLILLPLVPPPAALRALRTSVTELGGVLAFLLDRIALDRMGERLAAEAAYDLKRLREFGGRGPQVTTPRDVQAQAITVWRLIPLYREQLAEPGETAGPYLPCSPRRDTP